MSASLSPDGMTMYYGYEGIPNNVCRSLWTQNGWTLPPEIVDPCLDPAPSDTYFNGKYFYTTHFYFDIWSSTYDDVNERFSPSIPVDSINTSEWSENGAWISSDSTLLIFSSDRPGGYGYHDLYSATWDEDLKIWKNITNLGPNVNTSSDEWNSCMAEKAGILFFERHDPITDERQPMQAFLKPEDPCMVIIPGGEFEMGDNSSSWADEKPVHPVKLYSFYMSKYEVTYSQYRYYLNDAYSQGLIEVNGGIVYSNGGIYPYCDSLQINFAEPFFSVTPGKENHPMEHVSWYGAAAYCNWLSQRDGFEACYDLSTWDCDFSKSGYRLATEAEWEYAARGGLRGSQYPWGNDIDGSRVNWRDSGDPYETGPQPWTTPIGFYNGTLHYKADYDWPGSQTSYQTSDGSSGFGLLDMAGGVAEWCHDWYDPDYYSSYPYDNPVGPSSSPNSYRVLRGGGWANFPIYCRVSYRYGSGLPGSRGDHVGFRIVKPKRTYHVDCVNGDNGNDGLSKETAFETIQFAIDKANDGVTILVWPGVYNETATHGINFKGKAITVKSPADAAVLEVPGFVAATFVQGEDENSVFSNFVVRGSTTGIFALFANPTITNVTVVDNDNGVIADNADPEITNCIFWNNTNGDLFGSPDPITAQHSFIQDEVVVNLVAYWKLDGDATDSAGSNHGTIYGATPATGQIDGALSFDGLDDYVEIPYDPDLGLADKISIAAWIKIGDIGKLSPVISKGTGPSGTINYELYVYGPLNFHFWVPGWHRAVSEKKITDIEWHHVAATYDRTEICLYIDGILDSCTSETTAMVNNNEDIYLGAKMSSWPFDYLNGLLDEVAVYNQALSAEEIKSLYNAGLAGQEYGPLFADANNDDYHLLSERGRYRATTDEWILDDVTSPCVDGGDPNIEPTEERMPNGGRINMGAYGNTAYASMSEWPLKHDSNFDGIVNMLDLARLVQEWLEKEEWKE
jgi:formylglycine-generating enzyme required for sulfatase activity